MGQCTSKTSNRNSISSFNSIQNRKPIEIDGNSLRITSVLKEDETAVKIIQKELLDNPQIFVLNNLLMSVFFFENYQRDMSFLQNKITDTERNINQRLGKQDKLSCICPDTIFDKVTENVKFRPTHGEKKIESEAIKNRRYYILNDLLEATMADAVNEESAEYTSIDKPNYQVVVEESKHKGYFKMRLVGPSSLMTKLNISKKNENVNQTSKSQLSSRATIVEEENDYGYNTITEVNTPKPFLDTSQPTTSQQSDLYGINGRDTLPDTCFVLRKVENAEVGKALQMDVHYVSSVGFMEYFQNILFKNFIAEQISISEKEMEKAKAMPGKIFYKDQEIIPAVAIGFPQQAISFKYREERPTITRPNVNVVYRWPNDKMVEDIMKMTSVLVPRGCYEKRGNNISVSEVEWEIQFPKAEKYLETHMSNAQLRCYFFMLAIHKTFIEPKSKQHGLLPEHILHHIFWEVESNCVTWPEHRLGTKIISVINNLIEKLSVRKLPDFFIKDRNLFENVRSHYLLLAQNILCRVVEAPLMHFIIALRNLRYTRENFYPVLDFKDLYNILVYNSIILNSGIKKGLIGSRANGNNIASSEKKRERTKNYNNYHEKREEVTLQIIEEQRIKILQERQTQKNLKSEQERKKRGSVDSINIEWECEKKFDQAKLPRILIFFIRMYMDISKKCREINFKKQAQFYVKQSWYLLQILNSSCPSFAEEVSNYTEFLKKEEEEIYRMDEISNVDFPPSTPSRHSIVHSFKFQKNN